MGTASRVVATGAFALITGIYTVGLKNAELTDVRAADLIGKASQIERVKDAAFRATTYRVQVNVKAYRDAGYLTALNISGTRNALDGATYTYNMYVPFGSNHATGTVVVTIPENIAGKSITKTYNVEVKRVNGTGSTATGVRAGYRGIARGQWQMTNYW